MARVMLFGVVISVLAFGAIMFGQLMSLDLQNVLVGLALGGALGLVRTHSPLARISAFMIGFVLGLVFYALRLAILPATWLGNAIAVVVVLLVLTVISALTKDRLPLWAMFIGTACFAGAYNGYFNTTPWLFETQAISVAATMLFAVSAGFVVALLVEIREQRGGVQSVDPMAPVDPGGSTLPPAAEPASAANNSGLSVFTGTAQRGGTNA